MVSLQMVPLLVAVALGAAALCCLIRLRILELSSTYSAVTYFLIAQLISTLASNLVGVRSDAYEAIYMALLSLELLTYALMIREIYASIFSAYPGIAVLGRWCIYATVSTMTLVGIASLFAAWRLSVNLKTILPMVETAAHCLTLAFALLVLIILLTISRYPLRLHKNVLVNALLFSGILLGEALGLIADQITLRGQTAEVNLAMSVNTLVWLSLWPILLSKEGQTQVIQLRHGRNSGDEARLLGQLDALNALLLRMPRE
jgi:hypothetical protein